ncbi:MAG: hypothetical protein WCI51_21195, partial [Lentisphaerota bacterium]
SGTNEISEIGTNEISADRCTRDCGLDCVIRRIASKTLIIHFQPYITVMFNALFILSGRGLKTIKTSSSSLTLNVHFAASLLPASPKNTGLRATLNDFNIF